MLTKDEMSGLMNIMAENLKTMGLTDEEIMGTVNLAEMDLIRRGKYKEEFSKKDN